MKITPKASLVLALILFALSTPVLRWLIMNGGRLGLKNPGAISFCNVLFVGNLCAGLSVAAIFGIKDIYIVWVLAVKKDEARFAEGTGLQRSTLADLVAKSQGLTNDVTSGFDALRNRVMADLNKVG